VEQYGGHLAAILFFAAFLPLYILTNMGWLIIEPAMFRLVGVLLRQTTYPT
jgi:hypothetical protein